MTDTDPTTDDGKREAPSASDATGDDRYDVPPGAETYDCRYCGRPFTDETRLALHRGLDHPGDLDDDEVEAFRTAYEAEEDALTTFRLRALGALVLLYFGLLMVYALV
ncbi:C2H2-type zinc finger protein [Haloarcula salina]|uniref:C2H2-type zinc finger protein n=1 Tax=Haloarcula salina TaxID=1429914 RepID=A0AA41KIP7_9EURY|nr:C2H2-type zinc finger protein [Haloarcula salina]MBV0901868.1 C2H2-type zinc finger protein [Haloarcula salina]